MTIAAGTDPITTQRSLLEKIELLEQLYGVEEVAARRLLLACGRGEEVPTMAFQRISWLVLQLPTALCNRWRTEVLVSLIENLGVQGTADLTPVPEEAAESLFEASNQHLRDDAERGPVETLGQLKEVLGEKSFGGFYLWLPQLNGRGKEEPIAAHLTLEGKLVFEVEHLARPAVKELTLGEVAEMIFTTASSRLLKDVVEKIFRTPEGRAVLLRNLRLTS